jgi:hypothetical protein
MGAVPNRERLEREIIEEEVRAIICDYAGPWVEARKRHKSWKALPVVPMPQAPAVGCRLSAL